MKTFGVGVTTILLTFSLSALARTQGEGNIAVYGGPFLYQTNFSTSKYEGKAPKQGGLGFVVLGDVNEKSSLEIGFFLLNKIYLREDHGKYLVEETKLTQITMGYRRQFSELLSGSVTFSSGYSMGDPETIHNDFSPGAGVDTSVRDTTEYGCDLSLQAEFFRESNPSFIIDMRYSNSFTPKPSENADHYGVLFGLQYQLQEKTRDANLKK